MPSLSSLQGPCCDGAANLPAGAPASFPLHHEENGEVSASVDVLFAHLDDQRRLSSHMSKSSWMMLGSSMSIDVADGGRLIRLRGRVFGIPLAVDETVTDRNPPRRKIWQTIGTPRLLIIGGYRMGFQITPLGQVSRLRVFIDYDLPRGGIARAIGKLLAPIYARWCTRQMVNDAVHYFTST